MPSNTIVGNKQEPTFLSSTNFPHFGEILGTILDGCASSLDPTVHVKVSSLTYVCQSQHKCWSIFRKLIGLWAGSQPEFTQYLFERITPTAFQVPSKKDFDLTDATNNNILFEIASLLVETTNKCKDSYLQYLTGNLFPSLNCSAQFSQTCAELLVAQNADKMRDFLRVCKSCFCKTNESQSLQ